MPSVSKNSIIMPTNVLHEYPEPKNVYINIYIMEVELRKVLMESETCCMLKEHTGWILTHFHTKKVILQIISLSCKTCVQFCTFITIYGIF